MKRTFILTLLLSFVLFSAVTLRAEAQQNEQPYIELVGKATKEIDPDRIYMQIVINEKDFKNRSLIDIEKELINTLKSIGIDTKKNLAIKDMGSNFKHYFLRGKDAKLSKEFELITPDAKQAGKVIVMLQSIGISNVTIIKVENSKIEEYRDEMRVLAMKDARKRATLLAGAIDQEIGKAIYIFEQNYSVRSYSYANISLKSRATGYDTLAESYEAPDVEFEKITVEATVSVKFELK